MLTVEQCELRFWTGTHDTLNVESDFGTHGVVIEREGHWHAGFYDASARYWEREYDAPTLGHAVQWICDQYNATYPA